MELQVCILDLKLLTHITVIKKIKLVVYYISADGGTQLPVVTSREDVIDLTSRDSTSIGWFIERIKICTSLFELVACSFHEN